jgi:hypothetical protein
MHLAKVKICSRFGKRPERESITGSNLWYYLGVKYISGAFAKYVEETQGR